MSDEAALKAEIERLRDLLHKAARAIAFADGALTSVGPESWARIHGEWAEAWRLEHGWGPYSERKESGDGE